MNITRKEVMELAAKITDGVKSGKEAAWVEDLLDGLLRAAGGELGVVGGVDAMAGQKSL
jgi:hypothetical protein